MFAKLNRYWPFLLGKKTFERTIVFKTTFFITNKNIIFKIIVDCNSKRLKIILKCPLVKWQMYKMSYL